MNRQKAPCYKCLRRSQICHAQCKEYFDYVEECRREYHEAHKGSEGAAYAQDNRERWRRRKNLK